MLFFPLFSLNKEEEYLMRITKYNWIGVPSDILFNNKKAGTVVKVISYDNGGCLLKARMVPGFSLKTNMKVYFQEVFIGNNYLEVQIDSSLNPAAARKVSAKDTVLVYWRGNGLFDTTQQFKIKN